MSEVANWNILLPTGVLLSALVTFGMDSSIPRFVIDKEESEKKVIFSTGLIFVLGMALIVSFALGFLATQTANLFNISSAYLSSYWVLLAWLPGVIFSQYFQKWVQYTFQRTRFIGVIALQSAIYLIAVLYLKISNQIDLQNVMLATLVSTWIPGFLGLYFTHNMLAFKIDRSILVKLLIYGVPFMALAFGFNLIFSFDKYILSRHVSPEEFAIYSQAFRIAAIFAMIVSSFNFAFGPFSLSLFNKEDAPHTFGRVRTYYLFFMCLAGLSFIALGKLIILLLSGQDYIGGYKYIPLFVFGYILYGLYSFAQLGIIYSKKSYLGLYALIGGLLTTIGLDFVLVSSLKGFGTGIGFALGTLVMVGWASSLSKRYLEIHSNLLKDNILIFTFIICSWVLTILFSHSNLLIDGLAKLIFVAVIFGIILYSPPFKSEPEFFRQVLSNALKKLKSP